MKPVKLLAAALSCLALFLPLSFNAQAHDEEHEKVTMLENHPMLNAPGKKSHGPDRGLQTGPGLHSS